MKKTEKRYIEIVELLNNRSKIEVTELSEIFGVSQVTIRKDLDHLEEEGLIIREHGFATLNSKDDMNTRLAYHYDTKQKIAKKAAEYVHDGDTIMIESGSCCALFALEAAKTKKDLTIITNSAFIAEYIRKENVHVVLLGGEYQNESQVLVGPMTRRCAEAFHVELFFIGTDGFSAESGFTGNDYMRSETVRDMARQASKVAVITESSKFEQVGLVNLLPTSDITLVFTDDGINADHENYLISQNIEVVKQSI